MFWTKKKNNKERKSMWQEWKIPHTAIFSSPNATSTIKLVPVSEEDYNSSKLPQSKFLSLIKGKWVQLTFRLECQNFFLANQFLISGCKTPLEIFNMSKAHGGLIYKSWSFNQVMRILTTLHNRLPTMNFSIWLDFILPRTPTSWRNMNICSKL